MTDPETRTRKTWKRDMDDLPNLSKVSRGRWWFLVWLALACPMIIPRKTKRDRQIEYGDGL
jgi:hypothetical protein